MLSKALDLADSLLQSFGKLCIRYQGEVVLLIVGAGASVAGVLFWQAIELDRMARATEFGNIAVTASLDEHVKEERESTKAIVNGLQSLTVQVAILNDRNERSSPSAIVGPLNGPGTHQEASE